MSIYTIAVDFFNTLLGEVAQTSRGQLVAEYFGYIICGITIVLLIKIAIYFISFPFQKLKDR